MLALSGVAAESMVQDVGWTMMDIGKRIERWLALTALLRATLTTVRSSGAEQTITESTLVACESSVIYRRRMLGKVSVAAVADLVLFDTENPRSLVFQLERLRANLKALPGSSGSSRPERLVDEIAIRLRRLDPADLEEVTADGTRAELADLARRDAPRSARAVRRHHRDAPVAARWHAAPLGSRRVQSCSMTDGPIASASSRCYQITHRTVYRYSDVVTSSYGRGFLIPRDSARQRCLSHELIVDPDAADSSTSRDVYGNVSSYFHVTQRHHTLSIISNSVVEVDPPAPSSTAAGRRERRGRSHDPSVSTARWPPSSPSTCSRRRSPTSCVPTPHRVSSPAGR
jgi:hypothetical protein